MDQTNSSSLGWLKYCTPKIWLILLINQSLSKSSILIFKVKI